MEDHIAPAEPAPTTAGAALAQTLDEATLRRVFPDAPAVLDVPRDVKSIYRARLSAAGGERRSAWIIGLVVSVVAGIAIGAAGSWGLGGVLIAIPVVILLWVLISEHGKAADSFFDLYASARGLTHTEDGRCSANVPLFGKGDKRKWPRLLTGTIDGRPGTLGHYTYTDVSTDSDGNRTETDYHFTFLAFQLPPEVAARYAGVYCRPKSISFGALQDKLQHDRSVTLESAQFHKRYSLRVVDSQDDIALYELFSPPFIQLLVEQVQVHWEQRGADLVIWHKNHENEAADLDRFCLEAWHVLQRYLEEYQ